VVIAVGLTYITRSLSSQLKALGAVDEYATLTPLAHATLLELECEIESGRVPRRDATGSFDPPYTAYQWSLSASAVEAPEAAVPISLVGLTVSRADGTAAPVVVHALWPADLVPDEWQ